MDHSRFLDLALEEAERARDEGSVPVGTVIVTHDGRIVGRGRNRVKTNGDQTAHAEIDAIRSAGASLAPSSTPGIVASVAPSSGCILYTSAEPCLMCLGAMLFCPIEMVVWAATSVTGGAYDATLTTTYQSERVKALKVVREPSHEHRKRSRVMLREYYQSQGYTHLAGLLAES